MSMAINRKIIVENISKGGYIPVEAMVSCRLLDENEKEFRQRNANLIKEDGRV